MMTPSKSLLSLLLFFATLSGFGQAIGSLNLSYLYNPQNEIDLQLKVIRGQDHINVYYSFQAATVQFTTESCSIIWQKRDSFSQREGTNVAPEEIQEFVTEGGKKSGVLTFALPEKPWLLVAKVTSTIASKSWSYFKTIEANYPVGEYLTESNALVTKSYAYLKHEYTLHGSGSGKPIRVSYYENNFNPASPPFVESESSVDRFLFHDSVFTIAPEQKIKLNSPGLYLFQEDTAAAEGAAFRFTNESYPKYSRIEDLVNPLIYVCAWEEFDELKNAQGDKPKFDKVILDITRDKERAKNFMRSYFRKVELANLYFSSYKEGWKTDRGMIYLIYGAPDEVTRSSQNETWNYKTTRQSFTFVKTGSVYDPDYFVLIRDSRFTESWYTTVDLWRKSRF